MQRTTRMMRWLKAAAAVLAVSLIAGCGGGGGGGSSSNTQNSPSSPAPSGSNQIAVVVNQGVSSVPNIPTVTVTVCAPGSASACQTIDNVLLDSKSFGLRITNTSLSSVLPNLPVLTSGSGNLAECALFADGLTWGTVRSADVHIGGEVATSIPVQVIGDLPAATVPSDNCTDTMPAPLVKDTASAMGANGILGVGVAVNDCGTQCSQPISSNNPSSYFSCPPNTTSANCTRVSVPGNQQVTNPIAHFPADNNGVIVQFPAVPDGGSPTVTGLVTFGINTQTNNAMPTTVTVLASGPAGDLEKSTFNGANNVDAFLDTGSNGLFFSASLPTCGSNAPDFYCPTSKQTFSATLLGVGSSAATVSFAADNATNLFNSGNFALSNLAGTPVRTTLDLGLPFYFGRTVYHGFDLSSTTGQAPFIAF
ncbi:DUF3443 domain-containing protein [Paraburkholderia solisilvae]|uniref:DUF3443 domain-containing protein n=1 Tax=Paraburkholderia solisilvae TaxID=624376 RepID=A0A6J5EZT2_9BURK|nr:hypothetical protein LMG29739_06194 [Paraburkholderia solisilvae]